MGRIIDGDDEPDPKQFSLFWDTPEAYVIDFD